MKENNIGMTATMAGFNPYDPVFKQVDKKENNNLPYKYTNRSGRVANGGEVTESDLNIIKKEEVK